MNKMLKMEELGMFLLSVFLFAQLDYVWWIYLALILTPDIGMLGYLINTKIGAHLYNLFHHKGIAVLVGIIGFLGENAEVQLAGIILFGHSSMDRIFGYGLKYPDSFKHTHLGILK